jgi:hypothetical protein
MADECSHAKAIKQVTPSAKGCEECVQTGDWWMHLRLCRTCGHVGCCDQSPNKHATAHFHKTKHPVIEGYDPPEGWGWCYVDEVFLELESQTPQVGPIQRWILISPRALTLPILRDGASRLLRMRRNFLPPHNFKQPSSPFLRHRRI